MAITSTFRPVSHAKTAAEMDRRGAVIEKLESEIDRLQDAKRRALAVADERGKEADRLRATILNIQALAEKGFPIDPAKLATRCRHALGRDEQQVDGK